MKKYVIFNILVQTMILIISANLFFNTNVILFLCSLFIITIMFIPRFFEYVTKKTIDPALNYLVPIICLILFTILIAF